MSDLFSRVEYLDNAQTQAVYYSQSTSADIQVRIIDTSNLPHDAVLLQPEQALKLLAWLEKERETLETLANKRQEEEQPMLRRIWQFLNHLFRRKTYRETIQAEKPVMFLPLDVQLYDRVLSADEIKAHYEQSTESGTAFHDLSGHGYDAELRSERQP